MSKRFFQFIFSLPVLALALISQSLRVNAAIIGSETLTNLTLNFTADDLSFLPPGSSSGAGALTPIFSGQYWKVSAADGARIFLFGGARTNSIFTIQQVISGQVDPLASYVNFPLFDTNNGQPIIKNVSYLANAQPPDPIFPYFTTVTCAPDEINCVFAEAQFLRGTDPILSDQPFSIQASYQPPISVPEPSTDVGILAALGWLAALRVKKQFFPQSCRKDFLA